MGYNPRDLKELDRTEQLSTLALGPLLLLSHFSRVRLCATPWQPTRLLCPWNFPGKNSGVGCHFLSPGIIPTFELT